MASTAVSVLAKAVIMIAGSAGSICLALRSTSTPLMSGILMSEISRSTAPRASAASAIFPFSASMTSYPSRRSTIASNSRSDRSSSATRIRPARAAVGAGLGGTVGANREGAVIEVWQWA